MSTPLNVLLIEDNEDDAELLLYELNRSGFAYQWHRIDSEQDYRNRLHEDSIDLIVADYSLPEFSAIRALRILQEEHIDIPLIVVTGTVTEQVVVECLKLGASDYLLKDRLTRLGGAVTHALEEKRLRDEKRKADEALRQYAAELELRVVERTAELQSAKESVEAILNHTSDAIVLTSESGIIQRVNPSFERLFGYEALEILNKPLSNVADETNQAALNDAVDAARTDHEPKRIELTVLRSDGTSFVADVGFARMTEANTLSGIVCSIRDISQRKRVEEGLRQALEKERELNDLKSRFSSMVSHEFRTPLSVIQSSSDLLRNYSDRMSAERRDQQLESIQLQVRRLVGLLDDILALGKAQTVGLDFNPVPIDVLRFCQEIVSEMRPTAKTHQFTFDVEGDCYQTYADTKLLRQAITNLLSNAVKYSPEGKTVYVRLSCEGDQILIRIRDEGAGISKEDQQHLFEAFYRAKNVLSIPGSGLGLPIVKQAIEAHGGTVTCESEIGQGTTFTLTLPVSSGSAH